MKHTDFYQQLEDIHNHEIAELEIAIRAHGGVVEWKDNGPIISLSGTNMIEYPFDVRISRISLYGNYGLRIWGHNNEDLIGIGKYFEIEVCDIVTGQIANIIDEIPDTENVKDVSISPSFNITSICRDDLDTKGFDTSNVSDNTMKRLAFRMQEDYCDNLFWSSMSNIAASIGIPRKKENIND